jgi:transposase
VKSVIPHQPFKGRQRFGMRFLKPHEIEWLINKVTLMR